MRVMEDKLKCFDCQEVIPAGEQGSVPVFGAGLHTVPICEVCLENYTRV